METVGSTYADRVAAGRAPRTAEPEPPYRRRTVGDACGAGQRTQVLGCAIDRVDLDESLAYCEAVINARGFAQHMAINVAKLVTMRRDDLRASIERCELVTADGQPIVWASRLLGDPVPCRVAGIDLMEHLLALAARKGYRVYILGATAEVLEQLCGACDGAAESTASWIPRWVLRGRRGDRACRLDRRRAARTSCLSR